MPLWAAFTKIDMVNQTKFTQSDVTAHLSSPQLFHNVDWSMRKTWAGANEDCQARGGSLVSILNYEEEEFLALYSKGSTKWIGLKRNTVEGGE